MPGQGVLVRRRRVPQSGRRGARRRARRGGACHPPTFAPAPLDDTARVGARGLASQRRRRPDACAMPASVAEDTGASSLDRAIGSASHRQRSRNSYQSVVGTWTRVFSPTLVNAATASFSTFDNEIVPVASGPQLHVPQHARRVVLPRPAGHDAEAPPVGRHARRWSRGAHSLRVGGEWQRVDARVRPRRVPGGPHRVRRGLRRASISNGDGRVDDGDLLFAVTLRSGKPDQALVLPDADNDYVALLRAGRLARAARPDAEPRPALRDGHRRQERQPRRRDQPDRAAVPAGRRAGATGTTSARGSASTGRPATAGRACTAATASTTTASRCRSSRSSAGWTGARCPSKCAPATSSSSTRRPASFPPFAPSTAESVHRLHPARRRRLAGSTSSTTACRTRACSS